MKYITANWALKILISSEVHVFPVYLVGGL